MLSPLPFLCSLFPSPACYFFSFGGGGYCFVSFSLSFLFFSSFFFILFLCFGYSSLHLPLFILFSLFLVLYFPNSLSHPFLSLIILCCFSLPSISCAPLHILFNVSFCQSPIYIYPLSVTLISWPFVSNGSSSHILLFISLSFLPIHSPSIIHPLLSLYSSSPALPAPSFLKPLSLSLPSSLLYPSPSPSLNPIIYYSLYLCTSSIRFL